MSHFTFPPPRLFFFHHTIPAIQVKKKTQTQTLASSPATLTKSVKNWRGKGSPFCSLNAENLAMMSQDKSIAHCSILAKEWSKAIRLACIHKHIPSSIYIVLLGLVVSSGEEIILRDASLLCAHRYGSMMQVQVISTCVPPLPRFILPGCSTVRSSFLLGCWGGVVWPTSITLSPELHLSCTLNVKFTWKCPSRRVIWDAHWQVHQCRVYPDVPAQNVLPTLLEPHLNQILLL